MQTRAAVLFESPGNWEVTRVSSTNPSRARCSSSWRPLGYAIRTTMPPPGIDARRSCRSAEGTRAAESCERSVKGSPTWPRATMSSRRSSRRAECASPAPQAPGTSVTRASTCPSGFMRDGTYRMHMPDGRDVAQTAATGTFSEWQVMGQRSVVKVPEDLPLDVGRFGELRGPDRVGIRHHGRRYLGR